MGWEEDRENLRQRLRDDMFEVAFRERPYANGDVFYLPSPELPLPKISEDIRKEHGEVNKRMTLLNFRAQAIVDLEENVDILNKTSPVFWNLDIPCMYSQLIIDLNEFWIANNAYGKKGTKLLLEMLKAHGHKELVDSLGLIRKEIKILLEKLRNSRVDRCHWVDNAQVKCLQVEDLRKLLDKSRDWMNKFSVYFYDASEEGASYRLGGGVGSLVGYLKKGLEFERRERLLSKKDMRQCPRCAQTEKVPSFWLTGEYDAWCCSECKNENT